MTAYYSTFNTGMQELVRKSLTRVLPDCKIDLLLDGLVLYQTEKSPQDIRQIRFFNNSFYLLNHYKQIPHDAIAHMMNHILKKPDSIKGIPRPVIKGCGTFRIISSRENQTVAVNPDILSRMEGFFAYRMGMRVNRSKPDCEVWFLARSEGCGFAGIRLTRNTSNEKHLQKGELRPEIVHMMCILSEPSTEDVCLDPFAGWGAIPLERARAFPLKKMIAVEKNPEVFSQLQRRVAAIKPPVDLIKGDALTTAIPANAGVNKIITDPPWGIFDAQNPDDIKRFYHQILGEFERVLAANGLLILLTAQKDLLEKQLESFPAFTLMEKYDILVSGKKAAIYKIMKKT